MNTSFQISTDKSKLDIALIQDYLSNESYWAKGRSMEIVKKSIENSFCFGVYLDNQQIGFARVVTDYAVFAWILDVFILKDFQKRGLGTQLIKYILNHEKLKHIGRFRLATKDAHKLYEKCGFRLVKNPEDLMETPKAE